ncbi:MAG TPA: chitosanase [Actinoplanes sp.]|nr:chitosanase [Actinoplanes sp.]
MRFRVLPAARIMLPAVMATTLAAGTLVSTAPTPQSPQTPTGPVRQVRVASSVLEAAAARGAVGRRGLDSPAKKDLALRLVTSAENSSLNYRSQYGYIEDIGDGRGYTGGIIGFCSGTSDMLEVVRRYTAIAPGNPLARFLPWLRRVNGTDKHTGLGTAFVKAWRAAAKDVRFQRAQNVVRDRDYFNPAVLQAKRDGLRALGQFVYYDAIVMHGPGTDPASFGGIRRAALAKARTPAKGGSEVAYLHAFLDARTTAMRREAAHSDVSRISTAQRVFLRAGNLDLNPSLTWKVYGDTFRITR